MTVAVAETDPDAPIVTVEGDLDYDTASRLQGEIARLITARPSVIVVDFAGLRFMDSTGLAVIVRAWQESSEAGTLLRLRSTPRFLDTILDITGVRGLLARQQQTGQQQHPGQQRAGRSDRPAASA